uniref:Uncharacterized protein n=1 Tax=Anguilla anguilla TaxID=7936 RepID=A0A0E9WII5_ANGAN
MSTVKHEKEGTKGASDSSAFHSMLDQNVPYLTPFKNHHQGSACRQLSTLIPGRSFKGSSLL